MSTINNKTESDGVLISFQAFNVFILPVPEYKSVGGDHIAGSARPIHVSATVRFRYQQLDILSIGNAFQTPEHAGRSLSQWLSTVPGNRSR
jgi:hypothetical protein